MTVDDVKKIFFPIGPPPTPEKFLADLSKNKGEECERLFELFRDAFYKIEDDIERKNNATNLNNVEKQNVPNLNNIENQDTPNLNNVEKLNKYERNGSKENTKEYNDETSAVQQISDEIADK